MKNKNTKYLGELMSSYRKALGLSQREFAKKLDLPHSTIGRIENGDTGVSSKTLIAFLNKMNLEVEFVNKREEMEDGFLTPLVTVQYLLTSLDDFLKENYDVTNMKLQKLLYYLQMYSIGINGIPFFEGELFAWEHGPVSREVYKEFKSYKAEVIPVESIGRKDKNNLPLQYRRVLDLVVETFGTMSAYQLRNRTHQELPWKNAQQKSSNYRNLTHEDMYKEFQILNKLFINTTM